MAFDVESIIFCESPKQAKYTTFRDANDAGYRLKFGDIVSVKRAPEYDGVAEKHKSRKCFSKDFLNERQ